MSVGILLITHSGIGNELLKVTLHTLGHIPLKVKILSVSATPDPEKLIQKASRLVKDLDQGQGVLVPTDMFGSTPGNIAQGLQQLGLSVKVVTGLNLPMLFRIFSYPYLNLKQIARKAVSGGRDGVFAPRCENTQPLNFGLSRPGVPLNTPILEASDG